MMKKYILIFLCSVVAYGCSASNKDSQNSSVEGSIERGDYSFTTSLVKNENGLIPAVNVEGLIYNGTKIHFQCRCELIHEYEENDLADVNWISEEDINFDGIPDLMIYIGTNTVGRVSEFFDAYVWDDEKHSFEQIQGFTEIANPQVDAEFKRITSMYRSDANEFTVCTYQFNGNKLVRVKEEIEPIDANRVSKLDRFGVKAWIDNVGRVIYSVDKAKWVKGGNLADFFRINDGEEYIAYGNYSNDPAQYVLVAQYGDSDMNNIGLVFITQSEDVYLMSLQEVVACVVPEGLDLGLPPSDDMSLFSPIGLSSRKEGDIYKIFLNGASGEEAEVKFATNIPFQFSLMVNGTEHYIEMSSTWNIHIDGFAGTFKERYVGNKRFFDFILSDYQGVGNTVNGSFSYNDDGNQYIVIEDKDPLNWGIGKKYEINVYPLFD